MNIFSKLKLNIENNVNLWIALWLLLLLNCLTFISLSRGFSFFIGFSFLFLAMIGTGVLKILAEVPIYNDSDIPVEIKTNIDEAMQEIKPLCDEIFDLEINKAINPIIEDLRRDFFKGLNWLWENIDNFINQIEEGIKDAESVLKLFSLFKEEKYILAQNLQNNIYSIGDTINTIRNRKSTDHEELSKCLEIQRENLKANMENEKEIFYDYIYKLLIEKSQNEDGFNPSEHLDVYKLRDQFSGIIERSLESKLADFNDKAIMQLENFSADVVGRMQKSSVTLLNLFRDNQALLERLVKNCYGESNLVIHRLEQLVQKNNDLQEKISDILITLSWQDILVEKRWQDIKERLYLIKDSVTSSVDDEVVAYVRDIVDQKVSNVSHMIKQADDAVFYKTLLDAELVYQVYKGRKLNDILNNGVQILLQFVRPIEMLAYQSIRLNEHGLKLRKEVLKKIKTGEFNQYFDKVKSLTEQNNPQMKGYLEDIFPKAFNTFCNSPYVKKKPDNLNIAAWSLFLSIIEKETENDEIYLLVGFLLVIHNLRNRYIHPFRSSFIDLQDESEIEVIRCAAYNVVNLIIHNEHKGNTVSLNYKYK